MSNLLDKKCVPCEGGVKAFDISEIHKYQKKVDGWEIIQNDKKVYFLEKKFEFKNFLESQKFVNEVGKVSEEEGIIQILFLDGVMLRLISQLMP